MTGARTKSLFSKQRSGLSNIPTVCYDTMLGEWKQTGGMPRGGSTETITLSSHVI